ncbi:MAG: quinone-dependent dihydroorotate dehydrogenase [Cryomorphaceae bacterium]|nr:quinone-dependent dihydroorotate dehydrogenase [Cryomorphaceae bacterium]
MYKRIVRPFLFFFSPEKSHYIALYALKFVTIIPGAKFLFKRIYHAQNPYTCMGITFPNRVGLAAGFDKNAQFYKSLKHLGFGFIEVGTVTPKAQPGNPQPRLFRLPKDKGLINRMGFNNDGLDTMIERLKSRPADLIVGGNIGKNKITPNEDATQDYILGLEALHPYVDYFTINVSSPNTPGLRALQEKEPLKELLKTLADKNKSFPNPKPLLLKIAPDMEDTQLDDIVEIVLELKLEGVIATNTTIDRSRLKTDAGEVEAIGAGGLSGMPVAEKSTHVVSYLAKKGKGLFTIVASGGIFTPEDAQAKIDAGADLVQVYTGFIYEGPAMVRRIADSL